MRKNDSQELIDMLNTNIGRKEELVDELVEQIAVDREMVNRLKRDDAVTRKITLPETPVAIKAKIPSTQYRKITIANPEITVTRRMTKVGIGNAKRAS